MKTTTIKTRTGGHVTIKLSGGTVVVSDQDGRILNHASGTAKAARTLYSNTVKTWRAAWLAA